jgi:hypothetical protein
MTYEPPDHDPSDGPMTSPWGASQPPGPPGEVVEYGGLGRSRGPRRVAIGAAVAVAALLGGAGVAYAASGSGATPTAAGASPSPSSSASPPAPPSVHCQISVKGSTKSMKNCPPFGRFPFRHFGFPGGFPGGIGFPLGGAGGALHGQFVIAKSGGGYQTVDVQRGQVTAVSSSSITVKSTDGFSATYAVAGSTIVDAQRDGIGSVKDGNQVYVSGTVSGSKATATSISDLTLLGQRHGGPFGFGGGPSSNQNSNPSVS